MINADKETLDPACLARRELLAGTAAAMAVAAVAPEVMRVAAAEAASEGSTLYFKELKHGVDATHHVSEGFNADVLLRWGDPLFADAPPFYPEALTAEAQAKQFGYNCDFIGYFPLPLGSQNSNH